MHYFVDGYNLMFRLPGGSKATFEKRRNSLIDLLDQELSSIRGEVSVIFDSSQQSRDFAQSVKKSNIDILYAPKGKTADEYIIELVELCKNPKVVFVVTSDTGLATQCKQMGAQTLSIEEFFGFISNKNRPRPEGKPQYRENQREMKRLAKIFEERLRGY